MTFRFFPLCIWLLSMAATAQQAPLKLWYNEPATYFEEALPLGNGQQGIMVYGNPDSDKIMLNDLSLWSGEPVKPKMNPSAASYLPLIREALAQENYKKADSLQRFMQGKFSESYAPLGELEILMNPGETSKYYRELDIDHAIANVAFETSMGGYEKEYLVSYPHKVIAIKLEGKAGAKLNFQVKFNSLLKFEQNSNAQMLAISGYAPIKAEPNYRGEMKDAVVFDPQKGTRFSTLAKISETDGDVVYNSAGITVSNASKAVLYISMATSFNGFDKDPVAAGRNHLEIASRQLANALATTYEKIKENHIQDYTHFYDRVKLDLGNDGNDIPTNGRLIRYANGVPDPYLETLYFQFGRYLLIATSRTPNVPANLQGLWNPYMRPPWSSNYTMNINAEENYWLAENTNLSELHMPFLGFLGNLAVTGAETAKTFYNAPGWTCAHNSDIWAMTNNVGDFGKGDPNWANWNMGGTWASTHLYEHYTYTQDLEWLRSYAYPIMKGAAAFCIAMLIKDKNGKYITSPSTSPENIYSSPNGYKGATLYGATADLAMIRELFQDLIKASKDLGEDEAFANSLGKYLSDMYPYQISKDGHLQEWYHDWQDAEPTHRHQSHLFGLYPGTHINPLLTPNLADAAKKSLEIKGDQTTGWSKGWRINLWARLGDGDHAYKMYRELLKYVEPDGVKTNYARGGGTYPNLFDAHPPFQIDGNFGGAAAVAEMLVQSDENNIYILPALPQAWATGSISGLRARGGFEIDLKWENHKLQEIVIYSKPGTHTTIHYASKRKVLVLEKNESLKLNEL